MRQAARLFLVLILICAAVCPTAFADLIPWNHSYEDSLKLASREGKPIMVGFYTTWCTYCRKLDETTYNDSAVVDISKNFVCLKVDGEKRRDVAYGYGIGKFPTILFLDSTGRVIWREFGYRDGVFLARRMQEVLSVFKTSSAVGPYIRSGIIYLENSNPGMAVKDFSAAIQMDPNNAAAHFYRSLAYLNLKQYDKSWEDVNFLEQRGYKLDPKLIMELQRLSGKGGQHEKNR
jgi:thiol-disulfide isomerase/thioredoxin